MTLPHCELFVGFVQFFFVISDAAEGLDDQDGGAGDGGGAAREFARSVLQNGKRETYDCLNSAANSSYKPFQTAILT